MVIKIPEQVNRAIEILRQNGYSAHVVGGAVRDAIMGVDANDWDIATSALPEQTAAAFKDFRVIETGIKHGTVTVIISGIPLEITTFRIDENYIDNRHPEKVRFTKELKDDLGCYIPNHGHLVKWAENGVLLLNNFMILGTSSRGT